MIEVHAIHLDYELLEDHYHNLITLVDPKKQQRLARFKNFDDKARTLVGDLMLRLILSHQFNIHGEKCDIVRNDYGKPYLKHYNDLFFNISHSGDWVVIGISDEEIGIDIEKIQNIDIEVGEMFMTESEYITLNLQENIEDQNDYFYSLWTLKEAYTKAKGQGLSIPMNAFEVKFDKQDPYIESSKRQVWQLKHYPFVKDYKLATCSPNSADTDQIKYYRSDVIIQKNMNKVVS